MRIAQVAPLFESVPPKWYGGTERVVSYLTEALVAQGHDVTLFASGDSITAAELIPVTERSLRLDPTCIDQASHHLRMIELVARMRDEFDVIHFHTDYMHFPVSRRHEYTHVTTLHGRLNIPDLIPLYQEYLEMPVVSISNDQRAPLPWLNWLDTVYHGLPRDLYTFQPQVGDYFAFLGRISPEKRVDRAIEIAKQVGVPLKIAAKVDRVDREYFETAIMPLLDHPLIEYVGEIGDKEKNEFLGNARALLFPIDWPEPFGLVMIESMACGTPVVAFRCGSVPEVMDDGVTGFVVDDMDAAVEAAGQITSVSREGCRAMFERRFSSDIMASNYVAVYQQQLVERRTDIGIRQRLQVG